AATGSGPMTYQWWFNGQPISGANGPILTLPNVQPPTAGSYHVIVQNASGTFTGPDIVLTVALIPPTITQQPGSATVNEGSSATFALTAAGSDPLNYQWYRKRVGDPAFSAIPGGVFAQHMLNYATVSDAGSYYATVSNSAG